ncbi:glycine-rich domain-containing protein [Cerasicoccus maritimus]|uniref:glycine-rich domain-containing protein n=1 Tax=Cerasicoccus maritimus TaxID=490089 RepID=UPI002852A8CB|nr:hypothetical protein [Cerasicoccus maritimus]
MDSSCSNTIDSQAASATLLQAQPLLGEKIASALACDAPTATEALTEAIRFLALVAQSVTPLTPSHKVDLAWHEFILFTRDYHAFCQQHFGKYIHHTPGGGTDQNHRQYHATLAAYQAAFGPPSIRFWDNPNLGPAASNCGACEAS